MAKMIADDFNEAYRDYLEVKINSKSHLYELKEIFSEQSDLVKIAVNTHWNCLHKLPHYELQIEQV